MAEEKRITRNCTSCQAQKPTIEFYKQMNGLHGLSSWCKKCIAAQRKLAKLADPEKAKRHRRQSYLRHKQRHHETTRRWRKENPEKDKANRKTHYEKNKIRYKELGNKYRETNRDKLNAIKREWAKKNVVSFRAKNHARRARKKGVGGKYTAHQIKSLHTRQLAKCACCSKSIAAKYHIDHITPLAREGNNSIRNIQLLCPKCNLTKGAKDPLVFMREQGFLL